MGTKAAGIVAKMESKYNLREKVDPVEAYNDIHFLLAIIKAQDRFVDDMQKLVQTFKVGD